MDNGFHKSVASSETDTSKKQRDADFPYHQIGTHSGISNQLILRAEAADKNRNNQRPPANPSLTGWGIPGNINGMLPRIHPKAIPRKIGIRFG